MTPRTVGLPFLEVKCALGVFVVVPVVLNARVRAGRVVPNGSQGGGLRIVSLGIWLPCTQTYPDLQVVTDLGTLQVTAVDRP